MRFPVRRSRRSEGKAHVQHVLTAIAVSLERIDVRLPPAPTRRPRRPTALQSFLDWQHVPRSRSWRVATHPQAELIIFKVTQEVRPTEARCSPLGSRNRLV
ncbi:hypothetical protein GCM10018987_10150 [Streptomyces cremeus]